MGHLFQGLSVLNVKSHFKILFSPKDRILFNLASQLHQKVLHSMKTLKTNLNVKIHWKNMEKNLQSIKTVQTHLLQSRARWKEIYHVTLSTAGGGRSGVGV